MSSEIKVIDKAFQILNSFSEAQNNLSLKEIAKITSQNKSTIIRICRSLIKHNFLIKNELTGNYQLGPGAWKMGQIYNDNFDIANEIREILKDICKESGQSAGYWIRSGNKKVCLYRANNTESELTHHLTEGTNFPLVSATGKILLAFGDKNEKEMNEINKKGFTFTSEERVGSIASVAVPIFNIKNEFEGAINVSGWKQFFNSKTLPQFAKILQNKQNSIKKLLLK